MNCIGRTSDCILPRRVWFLTISSNYAVVVKQLTMSNPWRETRGYSFHSICLHVKDISLSSMFYQDVFGMDVVREANLGYVPEKGA